MPQVAEAFIARERFDPVSSHGILRHELSIYAHDSGTDVDVYGDLDAAVLVAARVLEQILSLADADLDAARTAISGVVHDCADQAEDVEETHRATAVNNHSLAAQIAYVFAFAGIFHGRRLLLESMSAAAV